MQVFVFTTEQEAEKFCTEGYPIFGKNLKGEEVQDRGITTRAADWVKHPDKKEWYVKITEELKDRERAQVEIDFEKLYPRPAITSLMAKN